MRLLSWTALGAACVAAYVAFSAHAISSLVYPRAAEDGAPAYRAAAARAPPGAPLRFELAAFVTGEAARRAPLALADAVWRGVAEVDADGGVALGRTDGIDDEGAEDEEGAAGAAGERALIVDVPRAARSRHANASAAAPAWAHVFASAPGARLPDELGVPALGVDRRRASALSAAKEFGGQYRRARLSRARAVPALADAPRNLLTGELAPHAANFSAPGDEHARNYWVPQLRVRFVAQPHAFPEDGLIPEIAHYAVWTRAREWLPVLHIDDAWVTKSQLAMCLNESTPTAPLGVSVGAIGLGRWRLYNLLEHQVGEQLKAMGGGDDDVDDVKEMLVLANPKMLALSLVVTVLHMFFEFLAVQADVRWWRERKDRRSMAGVSVRSVLMVAFCQLVVYLYVLEQKASLLVTVPMTIGVAVEMWKVVRALRGMTLGWRGLRLKDEEPYGANEVREDEGVKEEQQEQEEEEETFTDKKTDEVVRKPKEPKCVRRARALCARARASAAGGGIKPRARDDDAACAELTSARERARSGPARSIVRRSSNSTSTMASRPCGSTRCSTRWRCATAATRWCTATTAAGIVGSLARSTAVCSWRASWP